MDRRLLVLAIGMFALGTDSFVVAGVLPEVVRTFNISVSAAGQMTTAYAVTYGLLAPVVAALTAYVPRKQLLLVGLGIFVLANLATAIAPTFGIALATRALAGLGAATFSPTATGAATLIVPAERRGFALSVVIAGMTVSTAVGAPLGTLIGGLGNWRWTMVFVAGLATLSALGVAAFLSHIPMPPTVTLRKRLSPLADTRVGLALATTFLFFAGGFTIYTYFAVVFARTIGGSPETFSELLVLWGTAGTVSNLLAGRVIDKIGTRAVLNTMLVIVLVDFLLLPWSDESLWTAIPAIIVWGACGWGILVPQQYRLISIAPPIAPIILGLNNTAIYLGVTMAAVAGATAIDLAGSHTLPFVAVTLVVAALVVSELAARKIAAANKIAEVHAATLVSTPGLQEVTQ